MSKHTPEPWGLDDDLGHTAFILDANGSAFASMGAIDSNPNGVADARRIVACVNACRGLPTDELEQKGLVAAVGTELLEERRRTGMAIDAAIRNGVVPDKHPLRSRLEMLANHRQREQELLAALVAVTDHFAKVMGGPMISGQGVTFANGVDGIPTIKRAREMIAKAKGE